MDKCRGRQWKGKGEGGPGEFLFLKQIRYEVCRKLASEYGYSDVTVCLRRGCAYGDARTALCSGMAAPTAPRHTRYLLHVAPLRQELFGIGQLSAGIVGARPRYARALR